MPIGPARMSLMEHLGELRMRLVRIVVVLLVSCLIFYLATPTIAQFMLMPVAEYLPANEDGQVLLNVFGAFDAFGLRFQIAFWASLVATAPFILWQILAFFLPALNPKERKWFVPTFIAGVGLFILGTIFCYLIILPPAFEWLTDQASGFATIMPEASRWVDIIIKFEIGFGFGFGSCDNLNFISFCQFLGCYTLTLSSINFVHRLLNFSIWLTLVIKVLTMMYP